MNSFTNALGETISIEIKENVEYTAEMLEKILDGNHHAATILATEVHREIDVSDVQTGSVEIPTNLTVDMTELGIWIDPIGKLIYHYNFLHMFNPQIWERCQ